MHYGIDALRRSFVHFVLGRGISAAASLAILILLIRDLAQPEFAVYMTWHAMMLMVGVLSSLGVNPVLLRYIPELRAVNENRAMYAMLAMGFAARALFFAVAAFFLLVYADELARLLKFEDYVWLFPLYVAVGFLLVNSTFGVTVLESLLWQREAQYSTAFATLVRLAGILYLLESATLSLYSLVWLELVTELLTWMLLVGCALWRWRHDPLRTHGSPHTLRSNLARYMNFALWAYGQNLTSVLHGSPANRLFIGFFLPLNSIAVFGVVDRFIRFLRRYEPQLMFVGLVRPMFNSRYRSASDFDRLVSLAELLFRGNLFVLIIPLIGIAIGGDVVFDWLTKGKYASAAPLFLGFYVVVIIGSVNTMLDIIVKMVEHPRVYTLSNLTLSASLILAIPLVANFGLWSLVIANAIGYVLSVTVILLYLHRYGFTIRVDLKWSLRIVAAATIAIILGLALRRVDVNLAFCVAASYTAFVGLLILRPAFSSQERARMRRFWAVRKVPVEELAQPDRPS